MRTGRAYRRPPGYLLLLLALFALMLPAGVAASEQTASFTDTDPPDAPFDAHQSFLRFAPGAEAALHHHGGPGYITILSGELTLYVDGEEYVFQAGDSFVETSDRHYKGGNYGDEEMTLMVTYLVPQGGEVTTPIDDPEAPEPPEITPEPVAETIHTFEDAPVVFDVVHAVQRLDGDMSAESRTPSGNVLFTVVEGAVNLTIDGESQSLEAGESAVIEAGAEYDAANAGDGEALTMSTELVPVSGEVLPGTGDPVSRIDMVMWLLSMSAMALLVIGVMLRISYVRENVG